MSFTLFHSTRNRGFQTWEYASQYALRTYAYLLPLSIVSQIMSMTFNLLSIIPSVNISKTILFQLLRSTIAAFTGYSEVRFVQALSIYMDSVDRNAPTGIYSDTSQTKDGSQAISLTPKHSLVPFWTLFTSLLSAGMFHASPALLPSATVMQILMLSYSYYLRGKESKAVMLGLVAVLGTGWPFCALLWVPMGFKILLDGLLNTRNPAIDGSGGIRVSPKHVLRIVGRTIQHALIIQLAVSSIDYYYYGDFVFPTFNIIKYNALSDGDELYGVEDMIFYVRNLILNWNGAFILALLSLLPNISWDEKNNNRIILVPMIIWVFILFPRPHKEERFLFPIYPLISYGCALTLEIILDPLIPNLFKPPRNCIGTDVISSFVSWKQGLSAKIGTIILLGIGSISILRSMALSNYYTAPLSLYQHLHDHLATLTNEDENITVCVGGEWHRFSSSFFMPYSTTTLEFLPSRFKGQLPAQFLPNLNVLSHDVPFNDQNKEEPARYIEGGVASCNYLVELMLEEREDEPECVEHMKKDKKGGKYWDEVYSTPFLDAERTGFLDRVLYLPFRDEDKRAYAKYSLFRRTD